LPGLNNRMLRAIGITCVRRELAQQQAVLEGRKDSDADGIDAYPDAPGRSLGPHRTSHRQMVLTVGERPRATVRERRSRPLVRLAAVPAVLRARTLNGERITR
jgi:hypothetical protein